jgi:hypothetical protein
MKIPRSGVFGLCLAVFLTCMVLGCGTPAASEPDNFRNIKWGADVSTVSGLRQIAGEGDLILYERAGDQLQMGEVRLDQVIYGFYKGRFYMGMVYFPAVGFKRIEEMLTGRLGKPAQPDNTPSKLIWDGETVSVLLTLADSSDQARLVYLYKPIQLEVELKK